MGEDARLTLDRGDHIHDDQPGVHADFQPFLHGNLDPSRAVLSGSVVDVLDESSDVGKDVGVGWQRNSEWLTPPVVRAGATTDSRQRVQRGLLPAVAEVSRQQGAHTSPRTLRLYATSPKASTRPVGVRAIEVPAQVCSWRQGSASTKPTPEPLPAPRPIPQVDAEGDGQAPEEQPHDAHAITPLANACPTSRNPAGVQRSACPAKSINPGS